MSPRIWIRCWTRSCGPSHGAGRSPMKIERDGVFYALTIACSSSLLFLIQPMIAKAILPRFGGSAGVWVACMLFFQVALLMGYLYAHWITRLPRLPQTAIHVALLALSLWAL